MFRVNLIRITLFNSKTGLCALKFPYWDRLEDSLELDLKSVFYLVSVKIKIHNSHNTLKSRSFVGPIDEVMQVGQVVSKGIFMNIVEKFYVCRETDLNNQLNCKSALCYNYIFLIYNSTKTL